MPRIVVVGVASLYLAAGVGEFPLERALRAVPDWMRAGVGRLGDTRRQGPGRARRRSPAVHARGERSRGPGSPGGPSGERDFRRRRG